ncbi:uncharacterized protein KY384_003708 [Bacidia gigantensis]|uniref:uncharacterized protein n=1 Tax=Bacidia gigantensis TaxID=2732470 RepID=UPI001D03A554|nr:uncharacterized protein KY384_003708 [Bacidia gigantensis]KAG8532071.1 hypothetical protein KY384_003708 [Bacidia gigantensis]
MSQGSLSIFWSVTTVAKLLITTRLIHTKADIGIELLIAIFDVFAIIYLASVSGPMQWWIDGQIIRNSVTYAGAWETTGVVALILHFLLHLSLFVWAWRRKFISCEITKDSLRGPISFRRHTVSGSLKDVQIETQEMDFGNWLEKYDNSAKIPTVRAKEAGFELPLHMTQSMQHINRYGNSWEVASINKF